VKEYTTEEVAMIERATMDNAVKRAIRFEAIKIIADHNKLIPTSFVIVRCLKTGLVLLGLIFFVLLFCLKKKLLFFHVQNQMLTHSWLRKFAVSTQKKES